MIKLKFQNKKIGVAVFAAWLLVSLFYAYQYILRVLPNIACSEIMQRFDNIDAAIFGQFAGIYYIFYAGAHIPIGILLDRKGPKYVVPFCMLLVVAGTLPLIYSSSWILACLGRALIGIGSSAAILGVFKIIHLSFPEEKFSRMLGISVTIGLIGAIYGGQPVGALMSSYGYESVVEGIMLVGVVLACVSFVFIPNAKSSNISTGLWSDFIKIWSNKKILLIALCAGLMVGPLEGFPDAWGTAFLKAVYKDFSPNQVSLLPSLIFFGMCVGATVLTYIADKTKLYYELIIIAAFSMAAIFLLVLFGNISFHLMQVLFFITGMLCAYQLLAIYKATTYVKENLVGLTTSLVNMVIMLFGHPFHTTIGKVVHYNWDGEVLNGVNVYNQQAFIYGILVIPIALIIAGVGFILIRRSK